MPWCRPCCLTCPDRRTIFCCREWEFDQVSPRAGHQRKPKGHKHDKLAVLRCGDDTMFMSDQTCWQHAKPLCLYLSLTYEAFYGRQEDIQKNLDGMAERIQKYRVCPY